MVSTEQTVLRDVSLTAIVRNELMNPAGGIRDFIQSTVPFVEEAVIVDTGSRDGTRAALEELVATYRNMRVYDREFDGFDTSRNFSLGKVGTRFALVLDADERLTKLDFRRIADIMQKERAAAYTFERLDVYPEMEVRTPMDYIPRLFDMSMDPKYRNFESERLNLKCDLEEMARTGLAIKHFRPPREALYRKREFYRSMRTARYVLTFLPFLPRRLFSSTLGEISSTTMNNGWHVYNPRRDNYR